jgi:hypothetical protein
MNGQDVSVARVKKAIADYRRAVGRPEAWPAATFCCEEAVRLVGDGLKDEMRFSALVRMFEQGLTQATELPPAERHKRLSASMSSMDDCAALVGAWPMPLTRSGMIR